MPENAANSQRKKLSILLLQLLNAATLIFPPSTPRGHTFSVLEATSHRKPSGDPPHLFGSQYFEWVMGKFLFQFGFVVWGNCYLFWVSVFSSIKSSSCRDFPCRTFSFFLPKKSYFTCLIVMSLWHQQFKDIFLAIIRTRQLVCGIWGFFLIDHQFDWNNSNSMYYIFLAKALPTF